MPSKKRKQKKKTGTAAYFKYFRLFLKFTANLKGIGCNSADFWLILASKSSDSFESSLS